MFAKSFRRHNSTFVLPINPAINVPKKGKPHEKKERKRPQVPPKEAARQRLRRIEKAERDERMDIGTCLSPVKT
jgi:hypothetical protein